MLVVKNSTNSIIVKAGIRCAVFREISLKFELRVHSKVPFHNIFNKNLTLAIISPRHVIWKCYRIFMWFYYLHWDRNICPSPYVKLPMPFEKCHVKNTSKVVLSLFTAFYQKCYNLNSTIYTHRYSYFTHVNEMALMLMVHCETFKHNPLWCSTFSLN